jgi:hypothetical protein
VFVCTLSFSPQHGIKQEFCEVRLLAPQVARHLFSARKPTALTMCDNGRTAISTPSQVPLRGATMRSQDRMSRLNRLPNFLWMAEDSADDLRVRLGRARDRAARANERFRPFVKQVEAAIRKTGGDPNRIGGSARKGSGRFNARGRGAKLSFPKDGAAWQRDSAARFRTRRVVVKARVVKLNPQHGGRGRGCRARPARWATATCFIWNGTG